MALRKADREKLEAIQTGIADQIAVVYNERAAMQSLSDAKSVARRRAKMDGGISQISTLNSQLANLIVELAKPVTSYKAKPVKPPDPIGKPAESDPNESVLEQPPVEEQESEDTDNAE